MLAALASQLGESDALFESSIRGDSMSPAIPGGARVRVKLGQVDASRGDILYYLSSDGFVIHRCVHVSRRGRMITLGDNCLVPDSPLLRKCVLGAVIAVQTVKGWRAPEPALSPSICHRVVRAAAAGAAIVALHFGDAAACRTVWLLQQLESALRLPIGRILRRLHLIQSR